MFSAIRRHINPATVLAFVALVFAITGGAFAATGGGSHATLTASAAKTKSKAKTKPGPRGPAGAKGATGATGPAGAAGPTGATGPAGPAGGPGIAGNNGENGKEGTPGKDGTNGTSVTNIGLGTGSACAEGGAEFKVGSGAPTTACNGKTGFTETLPSGKTETGTFAISESSTTDQSSFAAISFPIPLANASEKAYGFDAEETANEEFERKIGGVMKPTGCTGTVAAPKAPPGVLCVYTAYESSLNVQNGGVREPRIPGEFEGYGPSGAILAGPFLEGEGHSEGARQEAFGSWAVTAP